jgi:chromosome segregation ATPase
VRLIAIACVSVLACVPAAAQTDLGAAAAKERERRKALAATASPPPAFTNDDLASEKQAAKDAAKEGASAKDGGKAGAQKPKPQPAPTPLPTATTDDSAERRQLEAGWRTRAQRARQVVAQTAARVTTLEQQIARVAGDTMASTDTNQILRLQAQRQSLETQLNDARQANSTAKEQLANLEEEARRAGVPPGWIR